MIINLPFLSQAKIVTMPNTRSKEPHLSTPSYAEAGTDLENRDDEKPRRKDPAHAPTPPWSEPLSR